MRADGSQGNAHYDIFIQTFIQCNQLCCSGTAGGILQPNQHWRRPQTVAAGV
jgi:hypothetical protein